MQSGNIGGFVQGQDLVELHRVMASVQEQVHQMMTILKTDHVTRPEFGAVVKQVERNETDIERGQEKTAKLEARVLLLTVGFVALSITSSILAILIFAILTGRL